MNNEVLFSKYANPDKDYTKEELVEIYKKIISDIENEKESK